MADHRFPCPACGATIEMTLAEFQTAREVRCAACGVVHALADGPAAARQPATRPARKAA